jgi:lysophospholipase L1-like esterase
VTVADAAAAPPRSARRRRRWSFVFVVLLLGLVLAAVLTEVAFRLFWTLPAGFAEFQQAGMYVATADRDTALRAGYRGTLQIGQTEVVTQVAINALGMRGEDVPAKHGGERRVLMVGDSLVFGYGVEAAQALPARLQIELQQRGIDATAGNGGVPSYGSRLAVAHMARLDAPFGTDAFVLCGYLGNDAMDDASGERTVYAGLLLQGPMARLVHSSWRTRLALRSRAALWLESWIFTNHREWSPLTQLAPDATEAARWAGMPQDGTDHAGLVLDVVDANTTWMPGTPPVLPRVLEHLRTSLQRARQIAGSRPLWFVILPTVWQVDEGRWLARLRELGFDPGRYQRGLAQQRWAAVAREVGIPVLDATPILMAAPDPAGLFLVDGGHFSGRGNEVVARWLAGELAASLR